MKKNVLKRVRQTLFVFTMLLTAFISHSQIGNLDTSFDPDEGPDNLVRTILPLADGKILIGGDFTDYNANSRNGIARLNADGTIDATFDPGTGTSIAGTITGTAGVYKIIILPEGKILIAGLFDTYNGTPANGVARLNSDGSLDTSFVGTAELLPITAAGSSRFEVDDIAVQTDGKVLVVGAFSLMLGGQQAIRKGIARLNADGSMDNTFNSYITPYSTNNFTFYCVLLQPDGQILVGGSVLTNATLAQKLIRLNPDGTKDTTFAVFSQNGTGAAVRCMLLQPDGNIIIGGNFTGAIGGGTRKYIARLTPNGLLDTTFDGGDGPAGVQGPKGLALQADGKVIVVGDFGTYDGVSGKGIVRINSNGTRDTSFVVGTGATSSTNVFSVALQPDGKVLIGGTFTAYKGTTRNRMARLLVTDQIIEIASLSEEGPYCGGTGLDINFTATGTFTAGNIFTAQLSDASGSFATPVAIGTLTSGVSGTIQAVIPTTIASGTAYRIRVVSNTPAVDGTDNGEDLTINVTPAPVAAAQAYCGTILVSELDATIISGATVNWYAGGTFGEALAGTTPVTTGSYYVSQTMNGCESTRVPVAISVAEQIVPNFAEIAPICTGSTAPVLELTSPNGVTGTWNPATISNTADGTYVFTPTIGLCASPQTLSVTVTTPTAPNFAVIAPVCSGSTAPVLELTSPNGVTGTWNPATISNTADGSYVFTPDAGSCATTQILDVTVTAPTVPNFAVIAPICSGSTVPVLELTSPNGVTGTWNPATISNTADGSYVFTPDAGLCATTQVLDVTVTAPTAPNFAVIAPICSGSTAPVLELTSPNGVTGTWAPATISNTEGGDYVFTPDAGQCAEQQTLNVSITNTTAPEGAATQDFNGGDTLADFTVTGEEIQWYDAATGGNLLPASTVIVSGTVYYASQTVSGCESIGRLEVTAGIDLGTPVFATAKLTYYPNPVTDVLHLENSESISAIAVYNLLGQMVLAITPNASSTELDMTALAAGSYVLNVTTASSFKSIKVIKK